MIKMYNYLNYTFEMKHEITQNMKFNQTLLLPLLILIIFIDYYTLKGIKYLCKSKISKFKFYSTIFWFINVLMFLFLIFTIVNINNITGYKSYISISNFIGLSVLVYIPKLIFSLFIFFNQTIDIIKPKTLKSNSTISRGDFIHYLGLLLAIAPFFSILYGIVKTKFDYRLIKEKIKLANLPSSFSGFRIIHISDIHLGSFNKNYEQVSKAIEIINKQDADIIVFTGDIVNNFAEEGESWPLILSKMKASRGKFSILGNHDYGDYTKWESAEKKEANFEAIKQIHKDSGFKLLLNEAVVINIGEEEIALIGVENWGKPPFPQYGDLNKACKDINNIKTKILLSHDPSHWDMEVLNTDINLCLSGHTHGMQFGINIAGIEWSPIKYKYPRWGGLYKEGNQFLYVNRGFGYIGFPGRVGMPPEITLIELT